jgi:hypothetical protein
VKNAIQTRRRQYRSKSPVPSVPPAPPPPASLSDPLPPASLTGWVRTRPEKINNVASQQTSTNVKKLLERARANKVKRIQERLPKKPYLDEIIVLGERVVLNEEGVPASSLLADRTLSDTVYFTPSYFPDETSLEKLKLAKNVFSKVFINGSTFSLDNPEPPCEASEFNLLKEGLENHLYVLRKNLPSKFEGEISMKVRNTFERAKQIKLLLEAIQSNEVVCAKYDVNFDTMEINSIKGYGKPTSKIDRERIQNLLRQFSFIVLQAINPIPGHEDKIGNITPEFLINALEQRGITKDEMDEYIAEYTVASNADIPDVIAHTLHATDTQDDTYLLMIESEMQNLLSYVSDVILKGINSKYLKGNFIAYKKEHEGLPIKDQLLAVVRWIVKEYSNSKDIAKNNMDTIISNKAVHENLQEKISTNSGDLFELESKLRNVTNQLEESQKEIEKLKQIDNGEKHSELISTVDQLKVMIDQYKNVIAERTGERDVLHNKLIELKRVDNDALKTAQIAQKTAQTLGGALQVASNPKDLPLLLRVEEIANAVTNGTDPKISDKSPFQEIYNMFKESDEPISNICYLTYFVTYFIRYIFLNNTELYKRLNIIIDEYLKNDTDIDQNIDDLRNILKSTENKEVITEGFYRTDGSPSNVLKYLYTKMSQDSDLNTLSNRALNYRFFNYNRSNLYVVPSQNGFIIKPSKGTPVSGISVYELSGNIVTPVSDNSIGPKIFEQTSLPYATVFLFYVLFSRRYLLIKENKSSCPLPKYLKDDNLNTTKEPLRQAPTVEPLPEKNLEG